MTNKTTFETINIDDFIHDPINQEKVQSYPPELVGRFNSFIVTAFDDSMTVEMQLRTLIKWIKENIDVTMSALDNMEAFKQDSMAFQNHVKNTLVNLINQFTDQFDDNLKFETIEILNQWVDEGILSDLVRDAINEEVIDARGGKDSLSKRLDESDDKLLNINNEIINARGNKQTLGQRLDETTARLAQTKPIKYLNEIPTTSDLNEGELGVLIKNEVKLKIINSYPKISDENVGTHDPIFVDFNMEINKETLNTISVRLFKITEPITNVVMLRGFDNVNNRMILFPTPALEPNTNYRLEITDGLRSTKGYHIGANKKYILPFTTGETPVISFDDGMTDYELKWTMTTKGTPIITKNSGFTTIQTKAGDEVTLLAMEGTVPAPATVDFLVKPVTVRGTQAIQFRIMKLAKQYVISLGGANEKGNLPEVKGRAIDFLGSGNELNKEISVDIRDYVHVRIAYQPDGIINAWINGFKLPNVTNRSLSGSSIQMVITSGGLTAEYDLHHVTVFNEVRSF